MANNQRHPSDHAIEHGGFLMHKTMVAHVGAMVGGEDDHGVFQQALGFDLGHELPDLVIHVGTLRLIELPGDMAIIRAIVPLAEVNNYQGQLKSVTGGQGTYTMDLSHYDPVPSHVQQQIVAEYKPKYDDD